MFDFGFPKVPQLNVKDLYNAIENKEDCVILDVRTVHEYERNKIAGSINLPVDEVEKKIDSIIPDKNKKIYVYCLSGSRSVFAVDAMVKMGYKNVYDIANGLLAWRVSNYPTV